MEDKKEKLPSTRIQWDNTAEVKLRETIDNSELSKNTSCILGKKMK